MSAIASGTYRQRVVSRRLGHLRGTWLSRTRARLRVCAEDLTHALRTVPLRVLRRFAGALPYALIAVCVAAVPAAVVYGYQYVMRSPDFAVRQVRVEGNARVPVAEILISGGVEDGPSLLALDLTQVERGIESHPWIASASVQRELPDQLVITVKEREPALVLDLGARFLVDRFGAVFKKLDPGERFALPIVSGLTWDDVAPGAIGERSDMARALVRGAITVLGSFSRSNIGAVARVAEIRVDPLHGYVLLLAGPHPYLYGTEVRLGRGDVGDKADHMLTLLADAEKRGLPLERIHLNDARASGRIAVLHRTPPALPEPEPEPKPLRGRRHRGRNETKVGGAGAPVDSETQRKAHRRTDPDVLESEGEE